jgi:hypothetical protein
MIWNSFAFPSSPEKYEPEFGLTKRELIAAMAMQGLLACPSYIQTVEVMASTSIRAADALIERLTADPVAEGINILPMYSQELDEGLTDGK